QRSRLPLPQRLAAAELPAGSARQRPGSEQGYGVRPHSRLLDHSRTNRVGLERPGLFDEEEQLLPVPALGDEPCRDRASLPPAASRASGRMMRTSTPGTGVPTAATSPGDDSTIAVRSPDPGGAKVTASAASLSP